MNEEKIKNWAIAIFYCILILAILTFTINYAFVDWDKISMQIDSAMSTMGESIQCKIDYKDFHYDGLCTNREEIFDFLNNSILSTQAESKDSVV